MKRICSVLLLTVFLCNILSFSSMAGGITCTHPSSTTRSQQVSSWNSSHQITVTSSNGTSQKKTCNAYNWVERVTSYCSECWYEFGYQDIHHTSHDLCGMHF